jgi:hypothetical protein
MPANRKVSVAWQIVFTFLPIVNFWAFYRIRKLRKYVLYIIVPSIILGMVYGSYVAVVAFNDPTFESRARDPWFIYTQPIGIATTIIGSALTGLTIYLVIIWSRQHNKIYDTLA